MTRIAVLDYGIGNLRSAQKALERVGAQAELTADLEVIAAADGIVLPGVGAFGRCMEALTEAGLADAARTAAAAAMVGDGRPFLGVCVGMQMLFDGSDESPDVAGLGVLPGRVRLLPDTVKRPQMQWNVVRWADASPMAAGQPDPCWMYFVHSYWAQAAASHIAGTCEYGVEVTAAVQAGSLWATQFHPEKSAHNGLHLLERFVAASEAAGGAEPVVPSSPSLQGGTT